MALPDIPADDIFLPGGRLRPELLTETTAGALDAAKQCAQETRWDSLRSPHIFMGLLATADFGVRNWANRLGADPPRLLVQFRELFQQENCSGVGQTCLHREFLSDNVIRLLRESHRRAQGNGRTVITPMDLLISLFTTPQSIVAECFERIGVTAAKLTELAVFAEQAANDGQ
jgi:ATP-dependent Clp protease ATP-binding subunit ClpA